MNRVLLAMGIALASGSALAATLDDLLPARDEASCWQRVYGAAHLADHPDQQVTDLTFLLGFGKFEESDPGFHYFGLEATLRDGRHGRSLGTCYNDPDGVARCSVDCDGGGVTLRPGEGGRLLVDLEAVGFIRLESVCGGGDEETEPFSLEAGLDDRLFSLHPAEPELCRALMPEW